MFPLHDDNIRRGPAIVTTLIIVLNLLAWAFVQGLGTEPALSHSVCTLGLIPAELLGHARPGTLIPLGEGVTCVIGHPNWLAPLTSMFLHGSWIHIIGNLWFLWVFGDNVEDVFGHGRFLVFYLLCGLAAAATQTLANPGSVLPMIGASGAIGGVLGAYAVSYPQARVLTLLVLGIFIRTVWVPAWLMLGYWFLLQFLGGLPTLGSQDAGVAFWAHIGGFVAGAALVYVLRPRAAPLRDLDSAF